MNNQLLKFLSCFSLVFITGCQATISSTPISTSNTNTNSSLSEISSSSISSEVSSSSSLSSSISENSSSSSIEEDYPVVEEDDKYIAEESKRVNVNINVTYPETSNEVYIIGDFNNWGKHNTLNDSSYKVVNGSISISNVENGESYEYMFVQKIQDATYTYNFNTSQLDSEGNQVIGYTKDGFLISQYCISQTNEKFSFVATEGNNISSIVSDWNNAIYGEQINVDDPNKSHEVPMSGYNLCVSPVSDPTNVYYIPLEARTDTDGEGRQQYAAYAVTLEMGDAFTIYDGNNNTGWAETNVEPYGDGNLFVVNSKLGVCALEAGTYDIYVKLAYENNRIYIEKTGSSSGSDEGGSGSNVAPTEGYALLVTPGDGGSQYYVILNRIDELDGQGREQYFGDNVRFAVGDSFLMFNGSSQVAWAEKALESYGQYENFTVTDNGIVCNVTGTYDIYAKFKWEDNTIYIGNQDGQ